MNIRFRVLSIFCLYTFVYGTVVEEDWHKFKEEYGKQYKKSEEEHFFGNFKKNLLEIENHNKLFQQGLTTYKKGITRFADLSGEEFIEKYMLFEAPLKKYEDFINKTSNSTKYFNWKDKGAVTVVKNQDICGACWLYSAVGVVEGHYFRKNNKSVTLSEQNIVDCFPGDTCRGGYPPNTIIYLMHNGINTAEDYPNKVLRGSCRYDKSKKVKLNITDYNVDSLSEQEITEVLENYGPVTIAIYANKNWRLYESGVWFEKECSEHPNHAVLLVGYGTENGHDYWLIKNSYGKGWGLAGYIKMARNAGRNYCGIEEFIMYIK
ncbi:procathepsin L-like [Diorhabda sublineata]|uniref:procathepsin L-like n=1 Tax=Diorhabda sublineata TaxID=1163346 RepID=UPI0024E0C897|nr:procathepsin L-like [Diorhabda sublineata]